MENKNTDKVPVADKTATYMLLSLFSLIYETLKWVPVKRPSRAASWYWLETLILTHTQVSDISLSL